MSFFRLEYGSQLRYLFSIETLKRKSTTRSLARHGPPFFFSQITLYVSIKMIWTSLTCLNYQMTFFWISMWISKNNKILNWMIYTNLWIISNYILTIQNDIKRLLLKSNQIKKIKPKKCKNKFTTQVMIRSTKNYYLNKMIRINRLKIKKIKGNKKLNFLQCRVIKIKTINQLMRKLIFKMKKSRKLI